VLSDEERATVVRRCFQMTFGREPSESETQQGVKHWISMLPFSERSQIQLQRPPVRVEREAIEENTGERFLFTEMIYSNADFVPDLLPSDCDAEIRALAELCLVLFNSNEFIFVY
jgi:hypothetical protein